MENAKRNFVRIIKEICEEEKIDVKSFSYDWIFQLCKNQKYRYVIGYQFGLNTASVHSVCCDKSAASEIMTSLNIPNVEHFFYMSPENQKYIGKTGNWDSLTEKLKTYGKLVCKINDGSGGNLVFRVTDQTELERAVHKIFSVSRSMAVSPYYEIRNEYRVIVLDGEIKLVYSKQRPCIIGDGKTTVRHLLNDFCLESKQIVKSNLAMSDDELNAVLGKGERLELNWKHNLGQGAKAAVLDLQEVDGKIKDLAKTAVEKMDVRFASIDIADCEGTYKILEINSGVMMEHFSQQDEACYLKAKEIYKEAVNKMFSKR